MKKLVIILSLFNLNSHVMSEAKPTQTHSQDEIHNVDPDYCAGIACSEETDTCCDESVE